MTRHGAWREGCVGAYLHDRVERSPVEGLALECGHFARHRDRLLPLGLGNDELEVGRCSREAAGRLGGIDHARWGPKEGRWRASA